MAKLDIEILKQQPRDGSVAEIATLAVDMTPIVEVIGPQGPQGETGPQGPRGVDNMFAFEIVNGELLVSYNTAEAPDLQINAAGELIYSI